MSRTKSAFDCKHVKRVNVWVILKDGKFCGQIVANNSDNPNGSVCTVTVGVRAGSLKMENSTGTAGGGGYNKFGAALSQAMQLAGFKDVDAECFEPFFNKNGYVCCNVC